jgi:predicted adenylyl cyclase CyaB
MSQFEIEIKSLLGSKENADALIDKMKASDSGFQALGSHKQLNHYFTEGDLNKLYENLSLYIEEDKKRQLRQLTDNAKDYSVRTRWADGKVIFVMKASVDDTTSSNGTARLEFETAIPDLTLDQLDKIILDSGFEYQAKWSRERQDFKYKNLNVSIDKNAGYGYLAEFESVINDQALAETEKSSIRQIMSELGVEELNQDRLGRMFDFYNKNWRDYYGTEKTFVIE